MGIKTRSDADTNTATPASDAPPAYAVDVTTAGAKANPLLTSRDIPNPLQPFLFFISASEPMVSRGGYYPKPKRVFVTPGLGYVGKNGELGNMLNYQESLGRMMVPTRTIVTAFGHQVEGYVRPHKMVGGRTHYTTAWERWKRVGQRAVWEVDHEGKHQFLEVCKALLGGDVDPSVHEQAIGGILAELRYLSTLPPYNQVAQARKAQLQALLPADHALSTNKPTSTKGATK